MPANAAKTPIRSYRDLVVWQQAMDLVVATYRLTAKLPKDELYGLVSQMRRAATSVPANIAEGQGRRLTGEFLHSLGIANGSLMELETHILISQRLGHIQHVDADGCLRMTGELGRMLAGLMRRLRERNPRPRSLLATGHRPPTTSRQ